MLGWICCSQLVLLRCPLWRPTLRSVDLLAFVNETWGDEADGEAASTPAAVEAPLLTSVLQDELGRLQTERARTPQRRGNSNGTRALSQAQGAQGAPSTAGVWEHDLSLWKELGVAPPSDEAPLSAHTASGAVVETGTRTEDETAATRQQGRQALEERARCLLHQHTPQAPATYAEREAGADGIWAGEWDALDACSEPAVGLVSADPDDAPPQRPTPVCHDAGDAGERGAVGAGEPASTSGTAAALDEVDCSDKDQIGDSLLSASELRQRYMSVLVCYVQACAFIRTCTNAYVMWLWYARHERELKARGHADLSWKASEMEGSVDEARSRLLDDEWQGYSTPEGRATAGERRGIMQVKFDFEHLKKNINKLDEFLSPAPPDLDDDDSVHDVEEASMPRPLPGPAEAAGGTGVFDSHADSGRHLSADGRSQRGVDAQSGVAGGLATLRSSWSILKQDFAILGGKG